MLILRLHSALTEGEAPGVGPRNLLQGIVERATDAGWLFCPLHGSSSRCAFLLPSLHDISPGLEVTAQVSSSPKQEGVTVFMAPPPAWFSALMRFYCV